MWPYWLVFALASLAAVNAQPSTRVRDHPSRPIRLDGVWLYVILAMTLMMGLRYQVGGDWFAYLRILEQARYMTFAEALERGDPGYWMTNYLVAQADGTIVWVNLCLGLLFSTGVAVFCRSLPRPWLALAVAFPYVILVVGMGYARQGVALGLGMIGFVALARGRFLGFVVWVVLGALFHKTAVVLLALGAMSVNRNRWLWIPIIGLAGLGGYTALLADDTDRLIAAYITAQYESAGALIRLSMNLVPATLFLLYRRRFVIAETERKFWTIASLMSVALFVALLGGFPSTALDRMALYLLPLQLFVFAHLPDVLGAYGRRNTEIVAMTLAYYALVLFVWLNFAANAPSWLPYQIWAGS